jgi:hypothetical protein
MASDRDQWADNFASDNSGGWLAGFLADEDEFDRRSLWRLGSWGVGSVAALVVALLAYQSGVGLRRDQLASADLVRQSQQIQWVAKESQNETRRLASAIETLNGDRDRLYSRLSLLEQGLDSVTGSIGKQSAAVAAPVPAAPSTSPSSAPQSVAEPSTASPSSVPPAVSQNGVPPAPVTTTAATTEKQSAVAALQPDPPAASVPGPAKPAATPVARVEPTNSASAAAIAAPAAAPTTPLMPSKSIMAPPDPAATRLTEPEPAADTLPALPPAQTIAAASDAVSDTDSMATQAPAIMVPRTEFGIDLGGANSIDGLRALWRGLLKSKSNQALAALRPIIVVKERSNGLGMQLRLVAGPLGDAAAAAKLCATLTESDRSCETAVFDGQRLALKSDSGAPVPAVSNSRPAPTSPRSSRRHAPSKGAKVEEPATDAAKPAPAKPSLTSFLGLR